LRGCRHPVSTESEGVASFGTLEARGYQPEASNKWLEKTERVTMNVVILPSQACLEPLIAQQKWVNYGFDKVQLRIYDTDKLAADDLAA